MNAACRLVMMSIYCHLTVKFVSGKPGESNRGGDQAAMRFPTARGSEKRQGNTAAVLDATLDWALFPPESHWETFPTFFASAGDFKSIQRILGRFLAEWREPVSVTLLAQQRIRPTKTRSLYGPYVSTPSSSSFAILLRVEIVASRTHQPTQVPSIDRPIELLQ